MRNRMDKMFEELVPPIGLADTVAGELVRATSRIGYRFYNDGDKALSGYGNETCNGSLRYIIRKLEDLVDSEDLIDEFSMLWNGDSMTDEEYEIQIYRCTGGMVNYIDDNKDLKHMVNSDDSTSDFNKPEDYNYEYDDNYEDDYYEDDYEEYTY